MPQRAASRTCHGWRMKDMVDAENRQFPVPRGEIKRLRWDTPTCREPLIYWQLEFGRVF
jgi:hypothetical protein